MSLYKELIELSYKVEDFNKIKTISKIKITMELSEDIQLPYVFEAEALHPGIFKGFTIPEEEIIKAKNTIFDTDGVFANNEINKDHKSNRKIESSVDDIIGRITEADYDFSAKAYILKGEIFDKDMALKVNKGLLKYVSLRIKPGFIDFVNNEKIARNLTFEEMSFVRAPGDVNAKVRL